MRKTVEITIATRDTEGNVNGTSSTQGYTDDEGATVVVGLGYLPGIELCQPGEIVVQVLTYAQIQPVLDSVTVDEEAGTQLITFAAP